MPSCIKTIPSKYLDLIHIVNLRDIMDETQLQKLHTGLTNMKWNNQIPGGFLKNTPQRLVNAFGNGSGYDESLSTIGDQWNFGYWTAAINSNDMTLRTRVEALPNWLKELGLVCRKLAAEKYDIFMDSNSFNLAVCNNYTSKRHEIAPHTDDNEWYVQDLGEHGPMFASLTWYPDSKPKSTSEHARFEVCIEDKWIHYALPHASILLMPSKIPHRVRSLKQQDCMHQRINITLRTVPAIVTNPYDSLRGVSNHARYYKLPDRMIAPKNKSLERIHEVFDIYNKCHFDNDSTEKLRLHVANKTSTDRNKKRKMFASVLKKAGIVKHINNSVVYELWKKVYVYKMNH